MALPDSTENRTAPRKWFIDPSAIMQIKNLMLRAKTVVEGFASGLHRSPLHGFSVEFAQYRPYVLGDDPRNLDWKLLARTDRCFVKQYEDETNRRCYIAVDQSRSMSFASDGYSKAEYARTLAATFAYYLTQQRDAVGLMLCGNLMLSGNHVLSGNKVPEYLPPRHRKGHLQQIMGMLGQDSVGADSDLSAALSQLAGLSKRRGLIVLLSDLLTDPESLFQPLGYLRGRSHEILVIRVLDPAEVHFKLEKSTMLRDMETGREIFVDPTAAAAEYRRRFDIHEQQLIDICHRRSARYMTITTDQPMDSALLELIGSSDTRPVTAAQAKQARA